jgi:hypothetical protein
MLQRTAVLAAAMTLAGALGPATARAQARAGDAPGLAEVAPFLMPDTSERTNAGVDVFFGVIDADEGGPLFSARAKVLTFEPYLDFALTPEFKIWGRLPIAYVNAETTVLTVEQSESDTLLGNAGLGARFMTQVSYELRAGGGVSVHLPTADADDDDGNFVDPPLTAAIVRFFQRERYAVDTTTVSGHGDLRYEMGRGYLQGQVAYLRLVAEDDDSEDADLLRLGLAGGYWIAPTVAAVAELTTLSTILDDDVQFNAEDEDEDFFHSLDLGLRFAQPRGSLSLRFHLPLDDVFRDSDLLGGAADLTLYF